MRVGHQRDVAEVDAVLLVERAQRRQRAVQPDALVVAGGAQELDHALALAQRVDAHQMSALGKGLERAQQLADLAGVGGMMEHRQARRSPR